MERRSRQCEVLSMEYITDFTRIQEQKYYLIDGVPARCFDVSIEKQRWSFERLKDDSLLEISEDAIFSCVIKELIPEDYPEYFI